MSALVDSLSYRQVGLRGSGWVRSRGGVVPMPRRPVDLRRPPRRARPVSAPLARSAVACGRPQLAGWSATLAIGLFVALFVLGFGLLAGASGAGAPLPETTKVIYVQPGESLWSIAQNAAPDSAPEVVVRRIHDLNALGGSVVRPGQALRVPDERQS